MTEAKAKRPTHVAQWLGTGTYRAVLLLAGIATAALVVLPVLDALLARLFYRGIGKASEIAAISLVILTFLAAAVASRRGRHLAISGATLEDEDGNGIEGPGPDSTAVPQPSRLRALGAALELPRTILAKGTEGTICAMYFWASLSLVFLGFKPEARIWIIPTRLLAASIPVGFLLMTVYAASRPGRSERAGRIAAVVGIVVGTFLAGSSIANLVYGSGPRPDSLLVDAAAASTAVLAKGQLVFMVALILSAFCGAPLFSVLGGLALVFLGGTGRYLELAPSEAYALLKGSQLAALPLFGLAGFILAESGAGKRLVAVFREFFGFLPGGEALAAVLVCAFFTTFTGANGVTIIALGGLLAGILVESGCATPSFARGIVTSSGAIGLLLPPSAAVIVYGINAQYIYGEGSFIDITELFKGSFIPGIILVLAMGAAGVWEAVKRGAKPRKFVPRAAVAALKPSFLEMLTPIIAAVLYFTGAAELTEIAGFTVIYLILVEGLVKRELGIQGLSRAFVKCLPVIGGTLTILAAARGLSFFLLDADIPTIFTDWVKATATSPFLFLLFLNIALLIVGCMMDIFSAILIAAPLIIPLGDAFGLNPIHLGVVFILNLCIGFLTPPVGMSLFFAGYAFNQPLSRIVKDTWRFLVIQLVVLGVITWIPDLTTLFLKRH